MASTSSQSSIDSLGQIHPLITKDRETGNAQRVSLRHFKDADEIEISAIPLRLGESLKRGGGARRKNSSKSEMDEDTLNKSKRRAATTIRRKALAMCADHMLTLTFRENVTDMDEAWRRFSHFNKRMKFRFRDRWRYVAVPERQKRGAVHFHLAIAGFFPVGTVRRFWLEACGEQGGNVDITSPKKAGKNSWNPKRVSAYLSKYISKSDVVEFNKRRYSSGGNIEIPDPEVGWLPFGAPVLYIMRQIIESRTRKQISHYYESPDGYWPFIYCCT